MGSCACSVCHTGNYIVMDLNSDKNSNIPYCNHSLPSSPLPKDYTLSLNFHSMNDIDKQSPRNLLPSPFPSSNIAKQKTFQKVNNNPPIPLLHTKTTQNYINIVIIGGKGVGKSCFLIKAIKNKFEKLYIPTIGIEKISRAVRFEGIRYGLNFQVTPGDEKYRKDYSLLFKGANVILLFYDVSEQKSFEEVNVLFNQVQELYKEDFQVKMPSIFLVGTKADRMKIVNGAIVQEFCKKNKVVYSCEISAKNGDGIKGLINNVIKAANGKIV